MRFTASPRTMGIYRGLLIVAGVIGLIAGLAVWATGHGAVPLMAISITIATWGGCRAFSLPIALSAVVIWSLTIWLAAGIVVKASMLGSGLDGPVLGAAAVAPAALALAPLSARLRRTIGSDGAFVPTTRSLVLIASLGAMVFAAVTALALWRFGEMGISWAMMGDARNQLDAFASEYGPTATSGLSQQPVNPRSTLFSLLAVAASSPGEVSTWQSIWLSMCGLWFANVLGIVAACIASAAIVMQALRTAGGNRAWAVGCAGSLPLVGIGVSIGLMQGFSSAILVIPLVTVALILGFALAEPDLIASTRMFMLATLLADLMLVLLLWSFVALPVLAILVAGVWFSLPALTRRARIAIFVAAGLSLCLLIPLGVKWERDVTSMNIFAWGGSIVQPAPLALFLVPLIATAALATMPSVRSKRLLLVYWTGVIAIVVSVAYIIYSPPGPPTWSYYGSKAAWIWIAATLGLAALPVARTASGDDRSHDVPTAAWLQRVGGVLRRHGVGLAAAAAVFIGAMLVSPMTSLIVHFDLVPPAKYSAIATGTIPPGPAGLRAALEAGKQPEASVLWGVVDPNSDKLANFLLFVYPQNRGDNFGTWAYSATDNVDSLCPLLVANPKRVVLTRFPAGTRAGIVKTCGIPNPVVRYLSGLDAG